MKTALGFITRWVAILTSTLFLVSGAYTVGTSVDIPPARDTLFFWLYQGRFEVFLVGFDACGAIPPWGTIAVPNWNRSPASEPDTRYELHLGFSYGMWDSRLVLPLWMPAVLAAAASGLTHWKMRRGDASMCRRCGYDLAGLPGRNGSTTCPECGQIESCLLIRARAAGAQPLASGEATLL